MSSAVSIIIVNYNAGDRLKRCLESLQQQVFENFEVIIFDNASTDSSLEGLADIGVSFKVIRNDENIGFAAANNRAREQATGQWLAFLNPDAYPVPGWLAELFVAVAKYPQADAFGSTQLMADNPDLIDGAGDVYHIFGIPYRGHFGYAIEDLPAEGECFAPCAAAALYRTTTFDALGGFDERFFCYGEDVDLGFRLRLQGGIAIQVAKAVVYHEGSGISGRHSDFTLYHGHRNRIWASYKNTPFWLYWPFLPCHVVVNLYMLVSPGKAGMRHSFWRGMKDGYRGLSRFRQDRRLLQSTRRVSYLNLARAMTWSPFKVLKREQDLKNIK